MKRTRRAVLASGAGLLGVGAAGCLGGVSSPATGSDGDTRVQTSFLVLHDFTRRVAGDAATVESIVPFGQHAHGWQPSAQVQKDVLESDAFVYAGEGFQPWADDVVTNLRRDAPDVAVVEARRGIELRRAGAHDESHAEDDRDGSHAEGEGGHDREGTDPHFWLDPALATEAVRNVERGLAEADGEASETYGGNADAFADRLAELDRTFEDALAETERDAVLVAGHDAFGYLGDRYGFEIHALTGVSPDAEPSARAISEAQRVVEEHGIEHVLAPALESDRAAKQLVAETDATEVLPVTALAGLTEEWRRKGWGYPEIMEHVNLASLRTALGGR